MTDSGKPFPGDIIHAKDVTDELDKKVNTSDVLSFEEIQATTDLTGRVASADSIKSLQNKTLLGYTAFIGNGQTHTLKIYNSNLFIFCGMGDSKDQYGIWYVTTDVYKILGDVTTLIITSSSDKVVTITNRIGWDTYYSVIGNVGRLS